MRSNEITFRFLSEPTDVNFGGNVHGGIVMKWIDQTAYACASSWSGKYSVTVFVSGIHFVKPIHIGNLVEVTARVVHTGTTSMHIAVEVRAGSPREDSMECKTHCVLVFVALDENGKPSPVPKWNPTTDEEKEMEKYAMDLKQTYSELEDKLTPYSLFHH